MSNKRIRLLADKLPNYPKTDNTKGKLQITNFTLVYGYELKKDTEYLNKIGFNTQEKVNSIINDIKYKKYDLTSVIFCNHFDNIKRIRLACVSVNMEYKRDIKQYIINVLSYNNMIDVSNIKSDEEFDAMLDSLPYIKSIFELAKTI